VLDADTVEWIKEHGGFKSARMAIVSGKRYSGRGGSADRLSLFKNFVGRDPYIEPLLKRRGLEGKPRRVIPNRG
jgi:peptidyl-dipeptidase Dcp